MADEGNYFTELYRLILTVADDRLRVPLEDGTRKHIRDLAHGDVLPLALQDEVHLLHFYEDDGELIALDLMPVLGVSGRPMKLILAS